MLFPYAKHSGFRPDTLNVFLHSGDCVLYSIWKVAINVILSEEFGLIGFIRESYIKIEPLKNMCCPFR